MSIHRFVLGAIIATVVLSAGAAPTAAPLYKISQSIALGSPDSWDYLTYDPDSGRLYVAHGNKIDVLEGASGKRLGNIAVPGANGIALVPGLGKGYAGSRTKKAIIVFDLKSLRILRELPADEDTDAVIYDQVSNRVFIMQGEPHNITVIDTEVDALVTRVSVSGQPEFAAVDGQGKLYVNITDKNEIQRIDTKTAKVDATWPISDCQRPHGLAISPADHRLFSSCLNSMLMVVDSTNGSVVAKLPIGKGSDAAAYDTVRQRILSSNSDGTLSVIQQDSPLRYSSLGDVQTRETARTMALDPKTGRIFLVAADRVEVDPAAIDPRRRFGVRPGSVALLIADPGG